MQRILLTQEDQKVVNRWRLVVVTIYSSIALALVLFVAFSPAGEMVVRLRREQIRKISHAPWLRLHSKGVHDCRPGQPRNLTTSLEQFVRCHQGGMILRRRHGSD